MASDVSYDDLEMICMQSGRERAQVRREGDVQYCSAYIKKVRRQSQDSCLGYDFLSFISLPSFMNRNNTTAGGLGALKDRYLLATR
jgi:hypothetical protein